MSNAIEPMPLDWGSYSTDGRGLEDTLGLRWSSERISDHFDPEMPADDRERVASVLETAGRESDLTPKGLGYCTACRTGLEYSHRMLGGDLLANKAPLRWDAALAHFVREHGLRIDPAVLADRFGVDAAEHRITIAYSSHGA